MWIRSWCVDLHPAWSIIFSFLWKATPFYIRWIYLKNSIRITRINLANLIITSLIFIRNILCLRCNVNFPCRVLFLFDDNRKKQINFQKRFFFTNVEIWWKLDATRRWPLMSNPFLPFIHFQNVFIKDAHTN